VRNLSEKIEERFLASLEMTEKIIVALKLFRSVLERVSLYSVEGICGIHKPSRGKRHFDLAQKGVALRNAREFKRHAAFRIWRRGLRRAKPAHA